MLWDSPVAEVYDRRWATIPAVIDRRYRWATIPAVIDRRYKLERRAKVQNLIDIGITQAVPPAPSSLSDLIP